MAARSDKNRRAAWKALVWAAGFFMAFQLAGSLLLDYRWPEVRFSTAKYLFEALAHRPQAPDVIALGSSRFGLAFFAPEAGARLRQQFPGEAITAFNASVPAGDVITADFLMERLLARGYRPAIVVVEISPETINVYNEWMGYHITRQLRWDDLPAFASDIFASRTFRRLLTHRLFPLSVYSLQISQYFAAGILTNGQPADMAAQGSPLESDQSGLDSQGLFGNVIEVLRKGTAQPTPEMTAAGLPSIQKWLRHYRIGGTSAAALERFLRRCRDNGVHVVLVGVPLHSEHRALYTPEIEAAFLHEMAKVTSAGCQFVDYRTRVPDHLFLDNHHLLPAGNLYFTRRLTQEVLIPAWRGRSP